MLNRESVTSPLTLRNGDNFSALVCGQDNSVTETQDPGAVFDFGYIVDVNAPPNPPSPPPTPKRSNLYSPTLGNTERSLYLAEQGARVRGVALLFILLFGTRTLLRLFCRVYVCETHRRTRRTRRTRRSLPASAR
jgi:hypothetical protein